MTDRPEKKFAIGAKVASHHHSEQGIVRDIEWSPEFGQWAYKLECTTVPRYVGRMLEHTWLFECDLKEILNA